MSFCTMCGSKLDDNAIACSTCGSVVERESSDAGYDYAGSQFSGFEPQFDAVPAKNTGCANSYGLSSAGSVLSVQRLIYRIKRSFRDYIRE